jgi:hypothetical protein
MSTTWCLSADVIITSRDVRVFEPIRSFCIVMTNEKSRIYSCDSNEPAFGPIEGG